MAGDYNMMGKGNPYEEVIRVPMIVVPPGGRVTPPRVSELVETSDLAATFLDYAGIGIPEQMQARSLRPLLEGSGGGREAVFCEYMTNDRSRKWKCVRTKHYKYVFWGRKHPAEFYDLQEDPDEMRNLYEDVGYRAEIDRHKDLMLDVLMNSEKHYYRNETPSARDLQVWLM